MVFGGAPFNHYQKNSTKNVYFGRTFSPRISQQQRNYDVPAAAHMGMRCLCNAVQEDQHLFLVLFIYVKLQGVATKWLTRDTKYIVLLKKKKYSLHIQ